MKTIRWGMIGCGDVTEVKSGPGLYKAEHSVLAGVTSRNVNNAHDFATRHKVEKVYDSIESLLAEPSIDIIYIATPPATHKALALQVARSGKHVFVEKPMAMRFAECAEIVDECAAKKVQLFVAFYRRALPRFLQIKHWIDEGKIGKALSVRVVHNRPPEPEVRSRETLPWRFLPEVSGGGIFLDMGAHTLDILDFFFGKIERVQGFATNLAGFYDVEDTVTATWQHQNADKSIVQGVGTWCYVAGFPEDSVEIMGTEGKINFEVFTDKALVLTTSKGVFEEHIKNPPHVHQPFIQSIVNELNGTGKCHGSVDSAVNTALVADFVLAEYRRKNGY